MHIPRPARFGPGFSLIELLITLALVVVLCTLMYGFGSARHQRTQKQLCADNLQKVYLAMQIYANDYRGKLPLVTNAATAEQPLELLVPKYSADTSIFICPGGRDRQLAPGLPLTSGRISYAYYMGRQLDVPEAILLTDRQIDTEPKRASEKIFSSDGKPPGNNHHRFGGNFLHADGSVTASDPYLSISLPATPGVVLLNPKP